MTNVLITGAGSYVGESVRRYILSTSSDFEIDAVDTMNDAWKKADFSKYDVVYHVAGIAHVNADPKMEPLYYKVNRNLTIDVARAAKTAGVKQFIFMSSQIVFHESQSLKTEVLTALTKENPNGFYNEYLKQELSKHKNVFEALGSKLSVVDADDQLSGVGFSSTIRNDIIVKVKGNIERIMKIKF